MKKLKLEIEALRVESFEPDDGEGSHGGTVHGRVHYTVVDQSCGCPVTDLAHTCTCADTSERADCFCTEAQTCWNCQD